jgi:hypothetical protein
MSDNLAPDHGRVDKGEGEGKQEDQSQRTEFIYPYVKNKSMPWQEVIVPDYIKPFIALKESQGSEGNCIEVSPILSRI